MPPTFRLHFLQSFRGTRQDKTSFSRSREGLGPNMYMCHTHEVAEAQLYESCWVQSSCASSNGTQSLDRRELKHPGCVRRLLAVATFHLKLSHGWWGVQQDKRLFQELRTNWFLLIHPVTDIWKIYIYIYLSIYTIHSYLFQLRLGQRWGCGSKNYSQQHSDSVILSLLFRGYSSLLLKTETVNRRRL